ncbi:hypothetical protein [Cohnella lupini]|uniref:Uncharacterized protein n=1 Tax=Cohnella lupini TaxID=1294267 RepID=A0A3D9HP00_9BACL|nr:hypothetical protein [Cohnella lupini]RED51145.1 hypothetical protein DFP95_1463 [Cohnella lupini]
MDLRLRGKIAIVGKKSTSFRDGQAAIDPSRGIYRSSANFSKRITSAGSTIDRLAQIEDDRRIRNGDSEGFGLCRSFLFFDKQFNT